MHGWSIGYLLVATAMAFAISVELLARLKGGEVEDSFKGTLSSKWSTGSAAEQRLESQIRRLEDFDGSCCVHNLEMANICTTTTTSTATTSVTTSTTTTTETFTTITITSVTFTMTTTTTTTITATTTSHTATTSTSITTTRTSTSSSSSTATSTSSSTTTSASSSTSTSTSSTATTTTTTTTGFRFLTVAWVAMLVARARFMRKAAGHFGRRRGV
mmetsp:Transcript_51550/g.99641  ORF Transcript_51550/g.99641 Transcript_51550/m.99641 type:complete len:216 (-) Transcript_51550:364-1011(-)